MGNMYDDAKYGVSQRKWFSLRRGYGGDCASGFAFASATNVVKVTGWYPKGPIKILKAGYLVTTAITDTTHHSAIPIRFYKGASGSVVGNLNWGSGSVAVGARGSIVSFTVDNIPAGDYMKIRFATAHIYRATHTGLFTTAHQCSFAGAVALFVDYIPKYSGTKFDT